MFRILVPLDGSEIATSAVGTACTIARAMNGRVDLLLVHTLGPIATYGAMSRADQPRAVEEEYLRRVAMQAEAQYGVTVTFWVLAGDPVRMICQRARELEADLVVMTTHGRTGFSRAWLGSIADGVVRRSRIPVLLLRAGDGVRTRTVGRLTHVAVPLDGSKTAERIIQVVAGQSRGGVAKLTLVQVVRPVPQVVTQSMVPWTVMPLPVPDEAATAAVVSAAYSHLRVVAAETQERWPHLAVDTRVVVNDSIGAAILAAAEECHADAIAMTTHGRGLSRLAVGSVADKVLRGATTPLLLLRAPMRKPLTAIKRGLHNVRVRVRA